MAESQRAKARNGNAKPRVFRVRNLPAHVDRLSAVELLCQSISGVSAQDIRLYSLAYDVDVWSWLRTKTATITLNSIFPALTSILSEGECTISVPGLAKPLIIDDHFQGVTPLNHVTDDEHKYDCLIISGLASHPFGSWQTHGHDKAFMWIRDELPQRLPGVRFLTYGYDTSLCDSTSFQLIPDLAISLVQAVKAVGWAAPSAKPVLFLAHSLGGVVLKQALVILAGGACQERSILDNIKGAVFFGVPSQGMSIPDILEMSGDQPNVALVKDLSNQSDFLPRLDEKFRNISWLQRLQFFWAFETKLTPSVEKAFDTGMFARTGPGTVMVSRESATSNLCHSQPSSTIQIDANHSDMVKFGMGNKYIGIFASKLEIICALSETPSSQLVRQSIRMLSQVEIAGSTAPSNSPMNMEKTQFQRRSKLQPEWMMSGFWSGDQIVSSLRAPERDRRLEQINPKLENTFNWAYDDSSAGLSEWLQKGTGIFWIHGKPASGKSTLMKYLYQDPRTEELLRAGGWQSRTRLTTASFFFHHRGNNMQKSFEGLLRSLVSQILEREKSLLSLPISFLADQYRTVVASARLDNLEEDIWALLDRLQIPWTHNVMRNVEWIVASQIEMTKNRRVGIHLRRMLKGLGVRVHSKHTDQYEEVDFDDSELISKIVVEADPSQEKGGISEWPEPRNWLTILGRTLQRHYQREEIKVDIQTAPWARDKVERCLRLLIGQSLFNMDLFLFLDALDEYDGRPEFIASFLQDLVRRPADPNKRSLTAVRILFSSRPWKALKDEFSACPGLQIHDYTANDIIEFCAASIASNDTTKKFLSPFVVEIVRRARGVFLWVELVVRDLAKIVLRRAQLEETQGLEKELRKTLDGIPDELDEYYQIIVERIPPGNRWESYVVLETLCRSDQDIEIGTLLAILKCSYAKSLADAKYKLEQDSQLSFQGPKLEWGERYIIAVSGGLVEVGGLSNKGEPILQFMHQTVKQFVEGPWFKMQLLGDNIGTFVTENGHSFIAKHLFVHALFKDRFIRHAREAETTVGFSQYDFFSTAPRDHYLFVGGNYTYSFLSMVAMAVSTGLPLCVRDLCNAESSCIPNSSAKLVCILLEAAKNSRESDGLDSIINITELLVDRGLSIDENGDGLLSIVQHMWKAQQPLKTAFERLALILLDAVKITSASTAAPPSESISKRTAKVHGLRLETKLLHRATPKLVRALLARGFSPNSLDNDGYTPMDFVFAMVAS